MALGVVEAKPNKQTYTTWWAFPDGSIVYRFEVMSVLQ